MASFLHHRKILRKLLPVLIGVGLFFQSQAKPIPPQQENVLIEIDSLLQDLSLIGKDDTSRVRILIHLASLSADQNTDKALQYMQEAQRIAEKNNLPLSNQSKVYFTLAYAYLNKADYRNSLFYYLRAMRIFEQLKKHEELSRCLNNIGVIYSYLGNIDMAERYFRESLAIRERYNVKQDIGILYTGLGYVLEKRKQYGEAIGYYKAALANGKENNNYYLISESLTDLGSAYFAMNNIKLAKKYYTEALALNKKRNSPHQLSVNYMSLSEVAMKELNMKQAETYLLQAREYAIKSGVKAAIKQSYELLSNLYYKQKKFDKAYENRLQYEKLNDSTLSESTYKQVNELQTAYEVEKKNNEIAMLNKDKELALTKASEEYWLRNILIGTCLLISIIVGVLIRNVKLKQRLNKSLSRRNVELTQENIAAKYETLIAKVDPHFLFNSLNTLSSIIHIDREQAIEFIERFSSLYRMIIESGDQQLLSVNEEMKVTEHYLYLQKVRFGDKLHISIHPEEATRQKMLPAFALQMVVENTIKHNVISSSKHLHISIYSKGNTLIIENNLQKKSQGVTSTGVGQKNIIGRYALLTDIQPLFTETEDRYIVELPLIVSTSTLKS